jgi:hypothetical protein
MAQRKWPSLRYDLARAIAPSKGVKRYYFLVYQNEAYSKLVESSGQGWQPCTDGWLAEIMLEK